MQCPFVRLYTYRLTSESFFVNILFLTYQEEMNKVYKELAQHLDQTPNGFPATKSGVELKILAKLFTAEEAELACRMELNPLSAVSIAKRIGRDKRETFVSLKGMVKKGLIEVERGSDGLMFKLIPFVVGFYERQNANIDKEFAQLFETYYHEALHKMLTIKPSVHRIIPVKKSIPVNINIMPHEKVSHYIEQAKSWGVLKCICRVQKNLIGEGCSHTVENCLVFSSKPNAFVKAEAIRSLSKEEALEILSQADKEGLVHSTSNVQEGVTYICNCCTCCCALLRGIIEYQNLNSMKRSDFHAKVDKSLCSGCGTCVDRCQFRAMEVSKETAQVLINNCFGCGLCVSTCPTDALCLIKKPAKDMDPPPISETDWQKKRIKARKRNQSTHMR
jgi:ferredoxin